MDISHLVRMANQIGAFFSAMPDRKQAVADIAGHLQKFWEPRMRRALLEFVAEHPDGRSDSVALDGIVLEAVQGHADSLRPITDTGTPAATPGQPGV